MTNPLLGNYAFTSTMHEMGHALGLKHGQELGGPANTAMTTAHDSMEYSIMTYLSYTGGPTTGYSNEQWGYAQTPMMYDIAAIQDMYGANFSGPTSQIYSFDPATGQELINGVGQGTPGANRIFRTIWDGGGNAEYDFSNYTTNETVDLTPGGYSTLSAVQLANLGSGHYADGEIFNALQYNGDVRSLIRFVKLGSGTNTAVGNAANDVIEGGSGDNTITTGAGADVILFTLNDMKGTHTDTITDYVSGTDVLRLEGISASAITFSGTAGAPTILVNNGTGTTTFNLGSLGSKVTIVVGATATTDMRTLTTASFANASVITYDYSATGTAAKQSTRTYDALARQTSLLNVFADGSASNTYYDANGFETLQTGVKANGNTWYDVYVGGKISTSLVTDATNAAPWNTIGYSGPNSDGSWAKTVVTFDGNFYKGTNTATITDVLDYTASYGDLVAAFGKNTDAAFNHFIKLGVLEGRQITFNGLDYIASYGDLIKALGVNENQGASHYISYGSGEHRTTTFNGLDYIASYGDLINALGANENLGAAHFISYGFGEHRKTTFNGLDYIASYADLITSLGADEQAGATNYISSGFGLGRKVTFNGLDYIASYNDLIKAFGANEQAGALHFIKYGYSEKRSVTFDGLAYIASYVDLIKAFGTNEQAAAEHYIKYGSAENRVTSFNPAQYLAANPDLALQYANDPNKLQDALLQYITVGYNQNRPTHLAAPLAASDVVADMAKMNSGDSGIGDLGSIQTGDIKIPSAANVDQNFLRVQGSGDLFPIQSETFHNQLSDSNFLSGGHDLGPINLMMQGNHFSESDHTFGAASVQGGLQSSENGYHASLTVMPHTVI